MGHNKKNSKILINKVISKTLYISIFILLSFLSQNINAQNILNFGLQLSPLQTYPQVLSKQYWQGTNVSQLYGGTSFLAGINANIKINRNFNLRSGIFYIPKRFNITIEYMKNGDLDSTTTDFGASTKYLSLPLQLSLKIAEHSNASLLIFSGPVTEYRLGRFNNGPVPEFVSEILPYAHSGYSLGKFRFALQAGAAINIKSVRSGNFELGITYNHSLSNMPKIYYNMKRAYQNVPTPLDYRLHYASFDMRWFFPQKENNKLI